MQQHISYQSSTKVASDPTRKIAYAYFILVGALLALAIGSGFFPGAWRDQLFVKSPDILRSWTSSPFPFQLVIYIFLLATLVLPFNNLPSSTYVFPWPFRGKWQNLERDRQQAVANRLSGKTTMTFPLPEVFTPLPATISVQMRRNWRATWIAGALYAPLIGIVLWAFVSGWQINMQYLAQQGELSAWTLLGSIPYTLVCFLCIVPTFSAFFLAPHQRLIATQDGLIGCRGLRLSYIPWQEARLFAMIAMQGTFVYELASSTSIIRWSSKPAWSYGDTYPSAVIGIAPLGLVQSEHSTEEYHHQIQQLTAMVAARTGLPLYDLCSLPHEH